MAVTTIRPICRSKDGVKIFLTMSDWPEDAILPPGTALWRFGDGPSRPYWKFVLQPTRTIEAIVGIFNMPLSVEALVSWYQTEMAERGWRESKSSFSFPVKAHLVYHHQTEELKLELSIIGHVDPVRCFVVLTRVGFHSWGSYL